MRTIKILFIISYILYSSINYSHHEAYYILSSEISAKSIFQFNYKDYLTVRMGSKDSMSKENEPRRMQYCSPQFQLHWNCALFPSPTLICRVTQGFAWQRHSMNDFKFNYKIPLSCILHIYSFFYYNRIYYFKSLICSLQKRFPIDNIVLSPIILQMWLYPSIVYL